MKSISLYRDNGTWLCRVHPFTKLMYIASAILVPLLIGSLWAYAVFIALDVIILLSGKSLKRARGLVIFSLTIILTIFIIRGLFDEDNITPLFSIGPAVFYVEGLMKALHTGCVIINMLLSFSILVLTSKPEDIADEMERHGFSPQFSYVISSVFSIIPQMMSTMSTITDAQKSRGMETEGSLSKTYTYVFVSDDDNPYLQKVINLPSEQTEGRVLAAWVWGGPAGERFVQGLLTDGTFSFYTEEGDTHFTLASFPAGTDSFSWDGKISQSGDIALDSSRVYDASGWSWR